MNLPNVIQIKAKKLGVLIRSARQGFNKSVAECAQIAGVSEDEFLAFELGEHSPSLPQLEMLAVALGIPVDYFWENELMETRANRLDGMDQKLVLGLRQRIIGVMLRKARVEQKISLDEMADRAGISAEKINTYELGQLAIPLPELEVLAEKLGAGLTTYRDQHGPLGAWFSQQDAIEEFKDLPPELQVFVTRPVNRPFLELARRLSEMDVRKLRQVAEGLLEITY